MLCWSQDPTPIFICRICWSSAAKQLTSNRIRISCEGRRQPILPICVCNAMQLHAMFNNVSPIHIAISDPWQRLGNPIVDFRQPFILAAFFLLVPGGCNRSIYLDRSGMFVFSSVACVTEQAMEFRNYRKFCIRWMFRFVSIGPGGNSVGTGTWSRSRDQINNCIIFNHTLYEEKCAVSILFISNAARRLAFGKIGTRLEL